MTTFRERLASFALDGTSEGAIKGWETRRAGAAAREEKHATIREEYDAAQASGASREVLRDIHVRAARASHGLPDARPSHTISVGGREISIVPNIYAERRGDTLVPVDVAAFDKNWKTDSSFYLDPHGSNRISNRYEKVGDFLKTATVMEAPEVSIRADGVVGFTDGRHRMAYLRDHGLTRVPVTMDKESLANARRHGMVAGKATSLRHDLEWDESDHPRENDGTFAEAGGRTSRQEDVARNERRDRFARLKGKANKLIAEAEAAEARGSWHETKVHKAGSSVTLPGRYDKTKLPKDSLAVTSANGYITVTKSSSEPDYLWVNHIWVRDEARGKGEGTALYKAALAAAKDKGFKGILKGQTTGHGVSSDAERVWGSLERKGLTEKITVKTDTGSFEGTVLVRAKSLSFRDELDAIMLGGGEPLPEPPVKDTPARDPVPMDYEALKSALLDALDMFVLGGEGSGNFGHAGRPGEVGGSSSDGEPSSEPPQAKAEAKGIRTFEGNQGYEWHERPEMVEYVKTVPHGESEAVQSYASFSYGDINGLLRGTYEPPMVSEFVRPATEEEAAQHKSVWMKRAPAEYDEDDPTNKVADGRIVRDVSTKDPKTGETVLFSIQKAVPDTARLTELQQKTDRINSAIANHGYALPEPMVVNRAAYVPGLSYDDLKAMEGETLEEKGFTSTMVGNPSRRLDGYIEMGKAESLYKRFGNTDSNAIYSRQDEVGASMRIAIILPEGTKVAPVEAMRRVEYEFPKVQDPEVFKHPEWLTKDDGTPNGLKASDYTIRDYTAKPTINTSNLTDRNQFDRTRSEAEVLLGSGAQFRVRSVQKARRIISSDPQMKPIEVVDVELEYVGGGSSDPTAKKTSLNYRERLAAFDLGGAGSGNFGHAGRPGEVGGSASEGEGGESPIERKRADFHELVKKATDESEMDVLRDGVNAAWKAWVEDINNRKKPLKETGAAAKKLDTYKTAKTLQDEFHAKYDALRIEQRLATLAAKELLKVPVEERSKLTFRSDQTMHPALEAGAKKALAQLREFDASGSFQPLRFPADKIEQFRAAFGDDQKLDKNDDGTFSLPVDLNLTQSKTSRAHATIFGIAIGGGRELERQVWHEVAHHIEMKNDDILKAAVAWREARATSPREVYPLYEKSPSLEKDEIAVRGKFDDPYTGKVYPNDMATEVISTGVEQYMGNPVRFARESPEHFNLIFDVMHGKYKRDTRIRSSDVK